MKQDNIQKVYDNVMKYLPYLLFGLIGVIYVFSRLFRLAQIPEGLHVDEAALAYDSLCLSKYGVDRYLKSWPVYMTDEGGGSSILYTYLLAFLFKIAKGYRFYLVKVPALLFSIFTFAFSMAIANVLFEKKKCYVWFAGLIVTVCPTFILLSRYGMDCNLMMGASCIFLFCFIKALESGRWQHYLLAGITGGLVLYTYALSYIIMPIFIVLAFVYTLVGRRFSLKNWLIMGSVLFVLAFPLIWVQLINLLGWPEMTLGIFTFTRLPNYRSDDLLGVSFGQLMDVFRVIFQWDSLNYNSIPGILNLYRVSILLFPVGVVGILADVIMKIRNKQFSLKGIILLWFISVFILEAMLETNVNRANSIYPSVVLICVEGLYVLAKIPKKQIVYTAFVLIACLYMYYFCRFAVYYYGGDYGRDNRPLSYYDITVSEALDFIEEHPHYQYRGTYMAEKSIYFALSAQVSPYDMRFPCEASGEYEGYIFGTLREIEDGYNYIVYDVYEDYAQHLRDLGYLETDFGNYSLFYMDWYGIDGEMQK